MSCLRSRVRPPGTPHIPPSPCHQSVRSPVIRVSVAVSRTLQFVLVGLLVLTGVMSYGSFRGHVGRSGDMSDTA